MEHVNASEMIAEIKQRQSEIVNDLGSALKPEQITYELSLDPITEDEIAELGAVVNPDQITSGVFKAASSKFNDEGIQEILDATVDGKLVEFAATLPAPRERSKLLSEGSRVNNTDTWVKYVYRTAYDIAENKKLGEDFSVFKQQVSAYLSNQNRVKCDVLKPEQITSKRLSSWDQKAKEYLRILDQHYLDPKSFNRAIDILNELKDNDRLDAENYRICIEELQNLRSYT